MKLYEKRIDLVFILCWSITLFITAILYYQSVFYFNRTPWDGTFQTLFPLLKMDNGYYPGHDFFYFHGNGIPYLIYPLYYIFNNVLNISTMLSALTSTFIINTIFLIFPLYYLFRLNYDKNISSALTLFFLALSNYIPYTGGYLSPLFLGAPMGVRFAPHLIMALLTYKLLQEKGNIKNYILFGVVSSICIFMAAEQGFYSVGGSLIVIFMYNIHKHIKTNIINSILYFVSFIVLFIILNFILFGNLATLKAIQIISNDQAWVFGVFPNKFYDSLSEVFSFKIIDGIPSQVTTIVSIFLSLLFPILIKFKCIDGKQKIFFYSILVLFFGSLLSWASNVGYIGAHQAALNVRYIYIISSFIFIGIVFKKEAR
ncbi:TPA: hypothetical protein ACX6RU_003229 [Photobacterium damselae]